MDAAGVLPTFTGVAVHDAWAPYDTHTSAVHALCGAHVLREWQAITEQTDQAAWCWARQAVHALREIKKLVDTQLAATPVSLTGMDGHTLTELVHRLQSAAAIGANQTWERSKAPMAKAPALARAEVLHAPGRAEWLKQALTSSDGLQCSVGLEFLTTFPDEVPALLDQLFPLAISHSTGPAAWEVWTIAYIEQWSRRVCQRRYSSRDGSVLWRRCCGCRWKSDTETRCFLTILRNCRLGSSRSVTLVRVGRG
ncbi:hypothetical protein GCM10009765_22510 [Fodinicola feengrottensis]|uniref:Transposase IS66 central domain-containing protein n=2 Tax=Fodinicola feengrottensis TaxID=435914 RepID=A0ABP4SJA7_9ACTN